MSEWKQEYEGFPWGFILWMWEQHRVGFLAAATLLVVGLSLLAIVLLA